MIGKTTLDVQKIMQYPETVVEIARRIVENDVVVSNEDTKSVRELSKPLIPEPKNIRKELWKILANPQRDKGLRWLNKIGALEEIIPCWAGNSTRRDIRLDAVEQLHLEVWRRDLQEDVYTSICDTNDVVVDRRLNRWALTALATLLAGGDTENQRAWSKQVRRDLHDLGVTEAENSWIERIIKNFNPTLLYLQGGNWFELRPEIVVATLNTIQVVTPHLLGSAAKLVNEQLGSKLSPLDT